METKKHVSFLSVLAWSATLLDVNRAPYAIPTTPEHCVHKRTAFASGVFLCERNLHCAVSADAQSLR